MLDKEFFAEATGDGGFRVLQMRPVEVARCADEMMAYTIAGMLNGQSQGSTDDVPTGEEETSDQEVEDDPAQISSPPAAPDSSDDAWTEAELDDAFEMLLAGQKLREVAEKFDKSWTKLRGHWARHSRQMKQDDATSEIQEEASEVAPQPSSALVPLTQTAYDKVALAITDVSEQARCITCGRHFTRTPDQLDHCARCSDG
ncbi:hypothetical protein TG4357_03341 [Thalassovita gelatinovora]|uniref:GcrA cell cycle regulator n=1 Tax=Thalassovita gelatinovora TaxID=53501 RepID=A0A0P1FJ77_THAGE|nr:MULTISPECIES: hypothetical protein [Thalassovita]QIZ81581.1 hypothetical protein HFZ77_14390 [Thalassovita gelatinovora]CUH68016.1 hypothetical protein TG4357_03341 [Thalassovita gelatinovora]SEQ27511.1 hypothetical protein SAMN04488043_104212 [Thalassovita gelatinovora]